MNKNETHHNLQDYFKLNDIASIIQDLDKNAKFENIPVYTLYKGKKMNMIHF